MRLCLLFTVDPDLPFNSRCNWDLGEVTGLASVCVDGGIESIENYQDTELTLIDEMVRCDYWYKGETTQAISTKENQTISHF